jgi:hypothetical protein
LNQQAFSPSQENKAMGLESGFVCNNRRGILSGKWGSTVVKVVYSDESGVGSQDELLTVVAAIIVNMDEQWHLIEPALIKVRQSLPPNLLEDGRAIKGRLLYGALRKEITETRAAREALASILGLTANLKVPIYFGAVERKGFAEYHARVRKTDYEQEMTAYDVAFEQCLTNVDQTISTLLPKERLLWIADRSDKQREPSTKTTLEMYRLLRQKHRLTRRIAAQKDDAPLIADHAICVADTIYFGNSKESAALQLVDVCCSTITLHLLETWYRRNPVAQDFYEIIRPQIINEAMPQYIRLRRQSYSSKK